MRLVPPAFVMSLSLLWAVPLGLSALICAYFAHWWYSSLRNAIPGLPYYPPSFPFGNLDLLVKYPGAACEEHCLKLGPVSSLWYFTDQWVVISRAEDVRVVMNNSAYRKPIGGWEAHARQALGRKSIALLMKDEWKTHRTVMNKAFHIVDIKRMTSCFVQGGMALCAQYLDMIATTGEVIDLVPALKASTMDIIGRTAFGYEFGSISGLKKGIVPPGVIAFEYILSELTRRAFSGNPLLAMYWIPTASNREHAKHVKVLRSLLDDIVQARLKKMAEGSADVPEDLLSHMITASKSEANNVITGESFTDALMNLMTGGFDTTATLLSFATALLDKSPAVKAKLHAELDTIVPEDPAAFTQEMVSALPYSRAILDETLRLYPPAFRTNRTVVSPVTLSNGVTIPANTMVSIPVAVLQRDPQNWPDEPDVFKPERFLVSDDGVAPYPPGAFVPFSIGRRDCVGRNFAMQEAVVLLAILHRRYEFVPVPGYTINTKIDGFFQGLEGGLPVVVKRRQ